MILELLPQISLFIFGLALIGYFAKYFYNVGYYRYAYNPISHQSFEKLFNNCSFGVILILLGIMFFTITISADPSQIPDTIKDVPISKEKIDQFAIYSYILALFIKFMVYISAFSLFVGFLGSIGTANAVHISTNEKNNPDFDVREIYSENEDFIFYLTLDGKWGSIRKSCVHTMEEIKKDSRIETWFKKDKMNKLYFILILIIYIVFVAVYGYYN